MGLVLHLLATFALGSAVSDVLIAKGPNRYLIKKIVVHSYVLASVPEGEVVLASPSSLLTCLEENIFFSD